MEVEFTQCFIPEIKRAKENLTITDCNELRPVLTDLEGNTISHQEWQCLGYRALSMTQIEFDLYEEWLEGVDQLESIEITT